MGSGNYKSAFKSFGAKVGKQSLAVAKDVSTALAVSVIERTPVDTSQAIANWNSDLNTVPQEHDPARRDPGGEASVGRAKDVASGMKLGDTFVVANSAPYVNLLEHGSSQQAPNGMVGVTQAQFPRIVEEAVKRNAR